MSEHGVLRGARDKGVRLTLVVAAALIDPQGRILLARRPEGKAMAGLWEFPGGKVESGETPERALARELEEELAVAAEETAFSPFAFASHPLGDGAHLLMPLYSLRAWRGEPTAREGQTLAWVKPSDLASYPTPPADVPLMAQLAAAFAEARP